MIKRSKIKYTDFPACLAALSFFKWGLLFSSVVCERSSQINISSRFSFLAFLTTASFFLFFLLPTTQSAHNNSRLCINLVLIDSSRLSTLNTVSTSCCHAFISVVFEASEWRLSSNFKVEIDESFSWKDALQVKAILWTPLRQQFESDDNFVPKFAADQIEDSNLLDFKSKWYNHSKSVSWQKPIFRFKVCRQVIMIV